MRWQRQAFFAASVAGRFYPFLKGTSRIAAHPRLVEMGKAVGVTRTWLRSGLSLDVDASDWNGRTVALFGNAEPAITSVCRRLLREGDVFFDIGANLGAVGLGCLTKVGATGEVHFFEPQRVLCERLGSALRRRAVAWRTHVHHAGLADASGTLTLSAPAGHSGAAKLTEGGVGETVPVMAAHETLARLSTLKSFGAKIDTEGCEHLILPGVLSLPNMRFTVFESGEPETDARLWEIVAASGHRLSAIGGGWLRPRIYPVGSVREMGAFNDFLVQPVA